MLLSHAQSLFEAELQKLVDRKIISPEVAMLPDMGEIPPPSPVPEDDGEDEEEDDDEEDEDDAEADADESEDEGGRPRKRRGPRSMAAITKREKSGAVEDPLPSNDYEPRKKRGRPPRVDTPMEAKIKAILKALRKLKGPGGS